MQSGSKDALDENRGFFLLGEFIEKLRLREVQTDDSRLCAFCEEHELAHALYALNCKERGLTYPPLKLLPKASGAVPLYYRGAYPWGALPYPREHAELARLCFLLGEEELSNKMAGWQRKSLDHTGKPLFSLFSQEGSFSYASLQEANRALFETLGIANIIDPASNEEFVDQDIGMWGRRTEERTILSLATGCKSGMGIYLFQDAGMLNYGPQLLPIGECSGFGLAGKPSNLHIANEAFSCKTRIAAPHNRKTGLSYLKDSGYSGYWIETSQSLQKDSLISHCTLLGTRDVSRAAFSFYGKGKTCCVSKRQKLHPRSLDRYEGPPQPLDLIGEQGAVHLDFFEGASQMVVIPLAGDDSFWGADFLVAFTLKQPAVQFILNS